MEHLWCHFSYKCLSFVDSFNVSLALECSCVSVLGHLLSQEPIREKEIYQMISMLCSANGRDSHIFAGGLLNKFTGYSETEAG